MTEFIQQTNFRNIIDIKSFVVESAYRGVIPDERVDNMLNSIKEEREMETREEYKQGCRETDIRTLVSGNNFSDLIDRIANFVNEKQSTAFKNLMVDFIVENNLVDDEELRWIMK